MSKGGSGKGGSRASRESLAPGVNAVNQTGKSPGKAKGNSAGVSPKMGAPGRTPAKKYGQ